MGESNLHINLGQVTDLRITTKQDAETGALLTTLKCEVIIEPKDVARILNAQKQRATIHGVLMSTDAKYDLDITQLNLFTGELVQK